MLIPEKLVKNDTNKKKCLLKKGTFRPSKDIPKELR